MISHNNLSSALRTFSPVLHDITENDIFMAYLPQSHVMEFMAENWCLLLYGIPVGYSSPLTMTDKSPKIKQGHQGDMSVLKPTVMASVPLVLDRVYKSIKEKVENGSLFKKAVFHLALKYKLGRLNKGLDTPIIDAYDRYNSIACSFLDNYSTLKSITDSSLSLPELRWEAAFVSSFAEERLCRRQLTGI